MKATVLFSLICVWATSLEVSSRDETATSLEVSSVAPTSDGGTTVVTEPGSDTTFSREVCSQEVSDQCPAEDPPIALHLPNPDDCSSFCECSGGTAFLIYCQDGLYYDTVLQACNWPNVVDCGDRPEPPQL